MGEYAKFFRVQANTKNAKGFSALITLPCSKSFGHEGDFINFYCGLGPFECGISTKRNAAFSGKWHWFANALAASGEPVNMLAPVQYKDGEEVEICLMIDETADNKIKFKVNRRTVHTSKFSYSGQANSRLIIACAQATSDGDRPLAPWGIFHKEVTAAQIKYKNGFNTWRGITLKNASCDLWRLPGPEDVPAEEFPEPQLYQVSPFCDSTVSAWIAD